MKTNKYFKYVVVMLAVCALGFGMTSCFDISKVTESKEKAVQVVKTTDTILTKSIVAMDSVVEPVKGTTAEAKVTETATKVKSALTVVQKSVRSIAQLLQIDLTTISSLDDRSLEQLIKDLETQVDKL